jgi:hypothetical protein
MRRVKNPSAPADYLSPEVAQLLATARTEIDRHLNEARSLRLLPGAVAVPASLPGCLHLGGAVANAG